MTLSLVERVREGRQAPLSLIWRGQYPITWCYVNRGTGPKVRLDICPRSGYEAFKDEVEGVLLDKTGWTKERAKEARETLRSLAAVIVDPEESISVVKDNKADNRILECAVAAGADFLVTGDKEHLLPLETFRGVKIVSPAGFLDICGE